jgi:molecular chaperone GrpE
VVDDLRQAALVEQRAGAGVSEGLRITLDRVAALLREFSIVEIAAVGEKFDPRWHEALVHRESDAQAPGTVLELLEEGYRLGDTLVRPSRVVVAKSPERPTEE